MKGIITAIGFILLPFLAFAKSGNEYREPILVYYLHHEFRDTIDFRDRLMQNDRIFVVYCAYWCNLSYKEFNLLYSQGIISKLKEENFHLIIVADKSPFLKLNHPLIDGGWHENVMRDFEVFYDLNGSLLKSMSSNMSFPFCLLINKSEVIAESYGLKEDYSFLLDAINKIGDSNQIVSCLECNGTGRVKPNQRSSNPDWVVGLCSLCSDSKYIIKQI